MNLKKNILAFFFIGILGTLGHFLYEWTGENAIVGMFFPTNESVWEHLKLIFFPTVIYSIIKYLTLNEKPDNYIPATAIGIFFGIFIIIAVYYITNGVLGFNADFINIGSYYVAIIALLSKKNKILNSGNFSSDNSKLIFSFLLIILAFLFIVWSYNPPNLGIFKKP